MPEVVRSLDIAAPPSVVWQSFASQEALREWLSPDLEIDLRVGGSYRMSGGDGTTPISGTVLELVPEGRLSLSWLEEEAGWLHPARLLFTLAPVTTGTVVTLMHDGFAGIGTAGWSATAQAYERGADRHRVLERLAGRVGARVS